MKFVIFALALCISEKSYPIRHSSIGKHKNKQKLYTVVYAYLELTSKDRG